MAVLCRAKSTSKQAVNLNFLVYWHYLLYLPFSNEVKCINAVNVARATTLVPFFITSKLIAFLIFMSYTLTGHLLTNDVVFETLCLFHPVMLNMTLLGPLGITSLAEMRITLARLEVTKLVILPGYDKLPYPYILLVFTQGQFRPSGIVVVCVSVCVSLCLCVNYKLVRVKTHHHMITIFGPEVKNNLVKVPIIYGVERIDLDLQGQIKPNDQNFIILS